MNACDIDGTIVEAHAVTEIARTADASSAAAAYVPIVARVPVSIRVGTMDDLPFIDAQQKANGRALGFLPTKAIEGKVRAGQVLVAEGKSAESKVLRAE